MSKQIWVNRHALRSQVYVNTRTTVATTKLGLLWWILDPLLLMVIYYFVVKIIFDRGGPNYHLFALCGIVTWQSFSRSINLCTSSLVRNASLIKQASIPMILYVIISPLVQAFFYLIGLAIIILWNYKALGIYTLAILFLVLLMILMCFTVGVFLAIFEVYIRDTGKLLTYVLRFGFYLSPILYSPDRIYEIPSIPEYAKILYSLNPMVHYISAVRDLLFYGKMFEVSTMIVMTIIALIVLQFGLLFFRKASISVPKMI